jgi:hypothetical protein
VNILEQILLDSPLRELNKEDLATSGRRLAASVVDLGRRRRRRRREVNEQEGQNIEARHMHGKLSQPMEFAATAS